MSDITSAPFSQPSPSLPASPATSPPTPLPPPTFRLWPALVVIAVLWLLRVVPPTLFPDNFILLIIGAVWGPMAAAGLLTGWWLFFSGLPWFHRWIGLIGAVGIGAIAWNLNHESMDGMVLLVFALPLLLTVWIGWLLVTPFLRGTPRMVALLVIFALSWGAWDFVRFTGTTGEFAPNFALRFQQTAEEKLMAALERGDLKGATVAERAIELRPGDWPGFRGAARDSVLTGVQIGTDWNANPPKELWRRPVGPGWSSFTVIGDRLYTQEQRGPAEVVVCYEAGTGKEIWAHKNEGRFNEKIAGPGPRATPTFHEGRIYTLSALGRLDCLDAATGKLAWTRNAREEAGAKLPEWGFASSPLVSRGVVSVFVGGPEGKSMMAYELSSGELAWSAGEGSFSYCSPHPARVAGVDQVLINTEKGTTAFDPVKGQVLWHHEWLLDSGMARVTQPAQVADDEFLLGTFFGYGTQRFKVTENRSDWSTRLTWTTKAIKPYYNDLVIHDGHLYGFDGAFFTCVSLADGKGKWRARGYGNGQVLLLKDQGVLLILTETGEVALVATNPEKHEELARMPGVEGKTWNHPVVAHGKLYIRNGEEAACFELPKK